MDKDVAIQQLKDFCLRHDLHRDKTIELYAEYKSGATEVVLETYTGYETYKFAPFWGYINTTDIRNIFKKTQVVEQDDVSNEPVNSTELSKVRKDMVTYKAKLNAERNLFNKQLRELSSLEELNREVIDCLKQLRPVVVPKSNKKMTSNNDVLLVQLSDLHINETTNEFRELNYNIDVANKRLQKFADKVKQEIVSKGINKVVIAMTGDIVNSDTILPKQTNAVTNKATALVIATRLLQQFILDIYSECQNISVVGVVGNEGRFSSEFFTDENLISNSPDFVIFNFLEMLLPNIRFIKGRNTEQVVRINGQNILFTHGNCFGKGGELGKMVAQTVARYADKGINIRFTVFGHLHALKLSNYFMRSSSLVGNNSYATSTLNLNSRASQNIAFISKDGSIDPLGIDLQVIDGYTGYNIKDELNKFNIKQSEITNNFDLIEEI